MYQTFRKEVVMLVLCLIIPFSGVLAQAKAPTKQRVITGVVISSDDKLPVIGANVWLKNSSKGTTTDIDGKFQITVEGTGGVLVFSYTGYKKQEVAIGNENKVNVTLAVDNEVLEELIVVGYGSQKKESVVGAISTLNVANLKVPASSISNVLAGQLAGVVAMTRSGEPGKNSAAEFYIRGVSSFKGAGSNKPLVLVDGIERDLDLVDTEDISTFSILKDASASAVYGVRGANGVILITTRKGAEGKPKINFRAEYGVTSPTKMPSMVNSMQWAELYNEATGAKYYSQADIDMYANGSDPDMYPNVNWINELYKSTASNQKINLNISGGGDVSRYYISGAYYNESSIFKETADIYGYNSAINYSKFNFRVNTDFNVTKTTVVNVNLANIYEKSFGPGRSTDDIWGYTFMTSPNAFPVQYSDGTIAAPSSASGYNPWNLLVHSGYKEQFWNSAQALIGITQDLDMVTKGLNANVKFSWDAFNTSTQTRYKEPKQYHAKGRDEEGNLIYGGAIYEGTNGLGYETATSGTLTTYMEGSLTYNRLFDQKHRIGGLFLYNHKIHNNTQAGDQNSSLPYKNQGIAGRATYAFNDTYFGEVNMGYNGSENFAPGHRFGFFPAFAAGWMMSSEPFWKPIEKSVNLLKLKASYGKVGNDAIGGSRRWIYMPTIVSGNSYNYGVTGSQGGSGIRMGDVENLDVSWEEALKINGGIEVGLFRKVKIQADYFKEHRTGVFLERAGLPALVGMTTIPYVNIGEAMNQGVDGTIEYEQKFGDLFVTARTNFTYSKNKLLNNDEPDWQYKYQNRIGKPFGSGGGHRYGLMALGLFESDEEIAASPKQTFGEYRVGDVKYKDVNGDGKIDPYDQVAIGYTDIPEIVYGVGATAQYKGFDLNIFFQGVNRVTFAMGGTSIRPFSSNNMERSAINENVYKYTWMSTNSVAENANAIYPRMSYGGGVGSSNNGQSSTWWLRDGSFVRLKNVEVGYSLPKTLLGKTFVKSVRVYVSGNNLLTFSPFKLWDPEKGNADGSGYPPNRVVSFGLNANF